MGVAKREASITALETPEKTAFHLRPGSGPPAGPSSRSERGVPISTSTTVGWATSPTTVHTIVPGELGVPMVRNHSGPRERMWGTLESVSALLTAVGFDSWASAWPGITPAGVQPSWGAVANSP